MKEMDKNKNKTPLKNILFENFGSKKRKREKTGARDGSKVE